MNVLLMGNFGTAYDGSICDEVNIAGALETLGHKVRRLSRAETIPLTNGPGKPAYDLILIAQWDGYDTEWLHKAKNYFMCPLVYWAFDYQADGQLWHEKLVAEAGLYLSKRIADSRHSNWRWACDFAPDFLGKHDPFDGNKDIDVLFTGSWLHWAEERIETLRKLNDNFNLVIHTMNPEQWPTYFKEVHGPVMDHELPKLISRAKVNIAIDHTLEAGYWSDRAAQVMACGGFCLQRYVPLMESYFHNNLAYFYSPDNAVEQTRWWLEHDEDREAFAANAFDASGVYKCQQRVSDVLTIIRSQL